MNWRIGLRARWIAGLCGVLLLAPALMGRPGVVKMKDGRSIEGDVTENPETVVITIKGIQTTIARGEVAAIEYPTSIDDEFKGRLKKLDAKDAKGRIELGRWAFQRGRNDLAMRALEAAMEIDPNNRDAFDMEQIVRNQAQLDAKKRRAATQPATAPVVAIDVRASNQRKFLTADEVNRIRQGELRESDRVPIKFLNGVQKRYADSEQMAAGQFTSESPTKQAMDILAKREAQLSDDVQITRDPGAMLEFKRIQPMILANCATSSCHGSAAGKDFQLYPNAQNNDAATYTNFYILHLYQKAHEGGADSAFGKGSPEQRMIDRETPDMSLLAQFALPPGMAPTKHPDVQGYHGFVHSKDDPHYKRLVDWIGKSLAVIPPDYGIQYDPPGAPPATQPRDSATTRPSRPAASSPGGGQ